MTTTMLNPEIELHAARRARNAALIERAVHGVGRWTLQDSTGTDLGVVLEHVIDDEGIPSFRAEWQGEGRHLARFALCHEDNPMMWFDLNMTMTHGDEITVNFT